MGSLSPQSQPSSSSANSSIHYLIYVAFCSKTPAPNTNMSNWIECYDPQSNSWHRVTTIPGIEDHFLRGFSMVSIGDSIYVIGGRLCHKMAGKDPDGDDDEFVEFELEVLPLVLRYNIRTNAWSKCAPMGTARSHFACTVAAGKIYAAGGQCMVNGARGISSAEVYDPAFDEWKPLPNMSTLRYKCVGVTWQEKIHVVGGFAEKADSDSTVVGPFTMVRSSAEVYDTRDATWRFMARMWELDVPPNQIVVVDGELFSCGDCFKAWKGHIEAYDRKQQMWNAVDGSYLHTLSSPISMMDATVDNWPPMKLLYLTMAPIGIRLYFLAGYRMPGEISRMKSVVHVFDTSANGNAWRSFEPVEEQGERELCCHCCVLQV